MWFFKETDHFLLSAQSPVKVLCRHQCFPSTLLIQNIDIIAFLFSSKILKHWSDFQGAIAPGPHSEPWKISSMIIGVTFTESPLLPFHFWFKLSVENRYLYGFVLAVCTMSFAPAEQCVFRRGRSLTRHGYLGSALLSRRPSLRSFRERNCRTRNCAQPCCAFSVSETLFGSMTPVQLSVTAFDADPSNVCSCDQEPGLLKPSKE